MSIKREKGGRHKSWVWDYFSIKETGISTTVCDICGEERRCRIYTNCLNDMRRHLSTKHTVDIYNSIKNRKIIHWESYFERVQSLTDSIHGNIKCKHCNDYNDILLQVKKKSTMNNHLEKEHNVTESDWHYLQDWRNKNTQDYYDLTEERKGSIKRTRLCKKCDHQFQRSNLCIMIKHLIQVHGVIPDVPLDKLPKELLELNYPVVLASSEHQQPLTSGRSDSSLQEPATLLMAELASFMDKYEQ